MNGGLNLRKFKYARWQFKHFLNPFYLSFFVYPHFWLSRFTGHTHSPVQTSPPLLSFLT